MPTFSLHEAMRYLVAAAIAAGYAYLIIPATDLRDITDNVPEALLVLIVFAAGALAFNAYRQLVYNPVIRLGFDLIRCVEWKGLSWIGQLIGIGPRNLLRRKLEIKPKMGWFRAIELWAFCQIKWMQPEENSAMRTWGAGVHAFYFLGTASIVALIFAPRDSLLRDHTWIPITFAALGMFCGLVTDIFLEQAETLLAARIWKQHSKKIRAAWKLST